MGGRPGRSGGHNRLSVKTHLLKGTYNATRHGPKPSPLVPVAAPGSLDALPAEVLDGLQARGAAFVRDTFAKYAGWSPPSLALLREAGFALDHLDTLRGTPKQFAGQRTFLALVTALNLKDL